MSRSIISVLYHEDEHGHLKPADGQQQPEHLDRAAASINRALKQLIPGAIFQHLEFEAEEASTNVQISMRLDARWVHAKGVEARVRTITREELIHLLQYGEVQAGQTQLLLHLEADRIAPSSDSLTPDETQALLDVLTDDLRDRYLKGWVRTYDFCVNAPDTTPVPGTSAWLGYILGNADRIKIGTTASPEDVAAGRPGQAQYLDSLPWAGQCARLLGWIKERRTPPINHHDPLRPAVVWVECDVCVGGGTVTAEGDTCWQCNGYGLIGRAKEEKKR